MTAIELANLSLAKIGVTHGITAINEGTRAAQLISQHYDHALRACLRAFPWSFATKYLALTLVQGPAWDADAPVQAWSSTATYAVGDVVSLSGTFYYAILASTNQTPPNTTYWSTTATDEANGDWEYAYRWPSDCLFARRLVPAGGQGRQFNETPILFRIGRDANGLLIYTHETDAVLEYTTINCTALYADDLFIEAFTWYLAGLLAPALSQIDKIETKCTQMFSYVLSVAKAVSSREQELPKSGEAEWINAR